MDALVQELEEALSEPLATEAGIEPLTVEAGDD